jgi:tRNA threonylcarbamoyladenosine biosynthesis protein TsaE
LAQTLRPGDAVLLSGDLGAGKSALARAAITALLAEDGREDEIPSPSFTLAQTYDSARGEIWHVDLYRLSGPESCAELGLEEAFETAIVFVEWPDRLGFLRPKRRLEIALDFTPDGAGRIAKLRCVGGRWDAVRRALWP